MSYTPPRLLGLLPPVLFLRQPPRRNLYSEGCPQIPPLRIFSRGRGDVLNPVLPWRTLSSSIKLPFFYYASRAAWVIAVFRPPRAFPAHGTSLPRSSSWIIFRPVFSTPISIHFFNRLVSGVFGKSPSFFFSFFPFPRRGTL